jgi:hypothetical protein
MRLRAILLLAFAVLLLHAARTRLAADPPPRSNISAIGWITPISPENTNCPVATHDLRDCPSVPPGHYLVIEKTTGWAKIRGWITVRGALDLDACAPYKLIRVRRLARQTEVLPPPCN